MHLKAAVKQKCVISNKLSHRLLSNSKLRWSRWLCIFSNGRKAFPNPQPLEKRLSQQLLQHRPLYPLTLETAEGQVDFFLAQKKKNRTHLPTYKRWFSCTLSIGMSHLDMSNSSWNQIKIRRKWPCSQEEFKSKDYGGKAGSIDKANF